MPGLAPRERRAYHTEIIRPLRLLWNVDRKRELAHLSGQCSEHKVHIPLLSRPELCRLAEGSPRLLSPQL
jgi:hypothetical protein